MKWLFFKPFWGPDGVRIGSGPGLIPGFGGPDRGSGRGPGGVQNRLKTRANFGDLKTRFFSVFCSRSQKNDVFSSFLGWSKLHRKIHLLVTPEGPRGPRGPRRAPRRAPPGPRPGPAGLRAPGPGPPGPRAPGPPGPAPGLRPSDPGHPAPIPTPGPGPRPRVPGPPTPPGRAPGRPRTDKLYLQLILYLSCQI